MTCIFHSYDFLPCYTEGYRFLLYYLAAYGSSSSVAQYIAENVDLRVTNIDNLAENDVFHQDIEITNHGRQIITRGNWAIYLCFIRMMEPAVLPDPEGAELGTSGLKAYHINGCLFKIAPTEM